MMSELRTRCCVVLDTSTSGDSPVTVIVSSSEPTRSSPSTVTAADPLSGDAFALDRIESSEGEGDGVGSGAEVDDLKTAAGVGDRLAGFFNQHGTGGFHSHPGQHGARSVFDNARNGRLRKS